MKRIVVLGTTGFVGTHVALSLKNEECELILACRNAAHIHPELKHEQIVQGDIRDRVYLSKLFRDADVLINAFSWTALYAHEQESRELFLEPSISLIDTAIASNVKRFINLSTASAANSDIANNANVKGTKTNFWPHLNNVIAIEEYLRKRANSRFEVINLRCGLFVGEHYGLGLLPILLPRLKTHLVPLIEGGRTQMPLISGEDIAQAFVKAAFAPSMPHSFEGINVLGGEVPTVKEVLEFIHREFDYPYPHFNVSFPIAHLFGHVMEILDPLMPFDPLVTRSIVHLLKNTNTDNAKAEKLLGYTPKIPWKDAVRRQINEIHKSQTQPMKMAKDIG
ncbi:MAG: NAD(P)-dependent oxidoreductase [Sulfuricurvum sp.]|uniref:NAD-dependent epimerase/dehydratase family protein n=1 Tax=Sulfuricurvum sp. TaxID=2025608 RepID=UPI0026290F82|nr:NAD(P)-dependent oxidoreductase [Sulfuricurvum sp.]MDD2369434.1 NAD(P)-dependent oxidoreductase [Sulfuricurvum sp.]MDD5117852.1 NAD(P)-dependent oxidoreductase [Sulfuricurvum sp.]